MFDVAIVMAKNEAGIIGRCVERAKVYARRVAVYDTGSTDDTVGIAAKYGADVYQQAWLGFGPTRTACYQRARAVYQEPTGETGGDGVPVMRDPWVLVLDADAYLTGPVVEPPTPFADWSEALSFEVRWERGSEERWRRPHAFVGAWEWHGPVHEFSTSGDARCRIRRAPQANVYVEGLDGARRMAGPDEIRARLEREAVMLEEAEQANLHGKGGRWLFYLAQTRDLLGEVAWPLYLRRARGHEDYGHAQESYVAAWRVIRAAGNPALDIRPSAETVEEMLRLCRSLGPGRVEAHVDAASIIARDNPARAAQVIGYAVGLLRDTLSSIAKIGGSLAPPQLFVDRDYYPRRLLEVAGTIAPPQVVHLAADLSSLQADLLRRPQ